MEDEWWKVPLVHTGLCAGFPSELDSGEVGLKELQMEVIMKDGWKLV